MEREGVIGSKLALWYIFLNEVLDSKAHAFVVTVDLVVRASNVLLHLLHGLIVDCLVVGDGSNGCGAILDRLEGLHIY